VVARRAGAGTGGRAGLIRNTGTSGAVAPV
jgi:hypothetical protein